MNATSRRQNQLDRMRKNLGISTVGPKEPEASEESEEPIYTMPPKERFRVICEENIPYIRNIDLPTITKNNPLEAVLIEYRCFPHLEFLIRNAMIKLGDKWSHTVVCGNLNYDFMVTMCANISPEINVIKTDYDNLNQSTYSLLLASKAFWELFTGEKILLYQEDSCIFKSNIDDFLQWDYVGAPWPKNKNDTPNGVGNGGFSLRTRQCMIEVIDRVSIHNTNVASSTREYMQNVGMTICPEDVYFSKNMQDYGIGKVADWDSASAFSTESIYNEDSFGGHNFWLSDEKWPDRILLPYCCAVIFHVGNCDVFKKIYNENSHFFKRNMLIFITLHDSNFIDIVKPYLPNAIFTVIENKGLDIGGFLHSMRLLIQHPNYNNIRFFYKFHTKTHDAWRQSMLLPLVNNYTKIEAELFNKNIPIIVGSKKTCCTNKLVNRNYMKDILDRNHENFKNFLHNDWREYMDEYIFEPDNYETNPHNSLNINPDFYKYYENDLQTLSNADLITHFEKFGKNEFHRICNPCYIKKFSKQSYFIAGTIFMCNKEYLKIFENINFEDEFNILENGYVLNTIPRRTHAWEYLFGLLAYCGNGYIISITESGNMIKMIDKYNEFDINIYKNCNKSIKNNWVQHFNKVGKNENRIYSHNTLRKKQAIINQNILSARLAIFLLVPLDNTSGGYRTLLNYMQKLTENNIYIDIYLGYDFDSINCYNGLSTLNVNIEHVVNIIAGFNVLDIKKYNFYLGFNVQRNYDILIANAWQTADAVYYNKSYCKHICYVIQDLEYLFYTDPMKKIEYCIKNGYKNEYKYYCLSNYLSQVFTHGFKKQYVYSSILGVDNKIYYNKNYTREKSIIIAYYTYKKGRLPELIENIINKLSITYKCYVFPCNYNKNNNNVINMGCLSINALNEIYNTCTVGIVMSNTNPSRLGFEMVASGLKVIEYDSEFTKYDMPNEYFTKIKNDNNIEHVVNNLINSPFIYSQDYVDSITIDNECNNFLNYINNMM